MAMAAQMSVPTRVAAASKACVSVSQSIQKKVGSIATSSFSGRSICITNASAKAGRTFALTVTAEEERFRLNNLSPQDGSRIAKSRKGRGHAAGQGATCGKGNRGQKSRAGPGVRSGFEGGQMPLYRRMPKLKGIAGGMGAGQPDYIVVNLHKINAHFEAGETVNLDVLKSKGLVTATGRDAKLPLKVLGDGEVKKGLTVSAVAFSESAKASIEAAGGSCNILPVKAKWVRSRKPKVEAKKAAAPKK